VISRVKEFQVEGADTEKAREEKLLVIPAGLVRRFVLEGSGWKIVRNECRQVERLIGMKCFPGGETQFVGNTMTVSERACEAAQCAYIL